MVLSQSRGRAIAVYSAMTPQVRPIWHFEGSVPAAPTISTASPCSVPALS